MRDWAARPAGTGGRGSRSGSGSAGGVEGAGRVSGLTVERTRLDEQGRLIGTGERTIPVQMVFRSVGYQSVPLRGSRSTSTRPPCPTRRLGSSAGRRRCRGSTWRAGSSAAPRASWILKVRRSRFPLGRCFLILRGTRAGARQDAVRPGDGGRRALGGLARHAWGATGELLGLARGKGGAGRSGAGWWSSGRGARVDCRGPGALEAHLPTRCRLFFAAVSRYYRP